MIRVTNPMVIKPIYIYRLIHRSNYKYVFFKLSDKLFNISLRAWHNYQDYFVRETIILVHKDSLYDRTDNK